MTITTNPTTATAPPAATPPHATAAAGTTVDRPTADQQVSQIQGGSAAVGVAVVLSGLFAGFFLTYTMSVQLGLAQVDDLTYVRTFQAINATIRNATFAIVFFGCVPSLAVALVSHRGSERRTVRLLVAGLVLCLATVAVTFLFNVPLNDELATYQDLTVERAARARADFEQVWNRWNLVRTVLAVAGFAAVTLAATTRRPVRARRT
jgi:uncharacterized membrane protein